LVAELMLTKVLKRAKELSLKGEDLQCSEPFKFFLSKKEEDIFTDTEILNKFSLLDDYDVVSALKAWQFHPDFILSNLSKMILNRDLLKVKISTNKISKEEVGKYKTQLQKEFNLSLKETSFFIYKGKIKNQAYNKELEPIKILRKDKSIEDVLETSDQLNSKALSKPVIKYYLCFPKVLAEK